MLNAERLQIVLTNTVDGIALLDANQRLVQWNHPFERGIGVALRAEMPLETMLRDQIATGMFGSFTNMGGEIARRMTVLRDSEITEAEALETQGGAA